MLARQDLSEVAAAEDCSGGRVARRERVVFCKGYDCDAFEEPQDAFMYFSERFFYGALAGLVALVMSEAGGEDDGAVDNADDFKNADEVGVPSKLVAAVGALDAQEEAGFAQLLKDFGENRQGDVIGVADFFGAGGTLTGEGEMAEGDQAVVGFFGELEHGGLRTESVLIRVYSCFSCVVKEKWFFLVLDSRWALCC